MTGINLLLFDLGGVLIHFSGVEEIQPLLSEPMAPETIRARFVESATLREYETGSLEPSEFARRFVADWNLPLSAEAFLEAFRGWSHGFLPGAEALLAALRPRYRIAALSNSNPTHWDRNTRDLGVPRWFDAVFSSHELRHHKPAPEIYLRTLAALGVTPDQVCFFDDSAANVAGAEAVGIRAFLTCGVAELSACLRAQGFLQD